MSLYQFHRSPVSSTDLNVSFEFFPPVSDKMEEKLWQTVRRIEKLSPKFVSVTYGAGGSTRERTLRTVKRMVEETSLNVAAHLTCVGATKAELNEVIHEFKDAGINRFVALRGDPAEGIGEKYVPLSDGYANGVDLTAGLKSIDDFDISVSAYPEKHPESADISSDIDLLKAKVDAGATRAITQFFFDNDIFEAYLEKVRKAGIEIPIVPGILPIHNFTKVANFSARCGTSIPKWFVDRFEGIDEDPQTRQMLAATVAAEQVVDLTNKGIKDFHFYSMNQSELPVAICRLLGIHEKNPKNVTSS